MKCPECRADMIYDNDDTEYLCPECNHREVVVVGAVVSDPADMMDAMIQKASVPNLAALFKAGKKRGLIQPQQEYGNAS